MDAALTVVSQAALAIDNARLSQQQKDFAETMQRSLLPSDLPDVPGLELGHVYESSAAVEVGGDVYDFLLLEDGRLAVVLGDVTGKGIGAAADMAMAKFIFRALARSYPEPAALPGQANEVVFEELELGKFITMLYVLVDPSTGRASCASAGHPPLRLVRPDGTVSAVVARGMALGIDLDQAYPEQEVRLERGQRPRPLHGRDHRGQAARRALRRGPPRRVALTARGPAGSTARRAGRGRHSGVLRARSRRTTAPWSCFAWQASGWVSRLPIDHPDRCRRPSPPPPSHA